MRPIRFRAWDGVSGRMLEVGSILGDGGSFWENYALSEKDVTLLQFTGLVDKNGQDVYEGDLVRDTRTEKLFEVYWREEVAGFEFVSKGESWMPNFDAVARYYKVEGNLYENPEMLKEN